VSAFGTIPPEPPVIRSLDGLAPKFRAALLSVFPALDAGYVSESLRTDARQRWLYGFGREYDDDRGIVTNAPTGATGWHMFGVALDFKDAALVAANAEKLRAAGLALGMDWPRFKDGPHVQAGAPMRQSPSPEAAALFASGGYEAVWNAVGWA
jgi:hypothetical protein